MDTKKLPPALLMALGLAGCGGDDDGTATTGPCLDVAPMTESASETATSACLSTEFTTTGSDSGSGSGDDSTTFGPCLDAPPGTSTGEETTSSGSGSDSGSESGSGSGTGDAAVREEVVRTLVGRGILPEDVAAKLRGGE